LTEKKGEKEKKDGCGVGMGQGVANNNTAANTPIGPWEGGKKKKQEGTRHIVHFYMVKQVVSRDRGRGKRGIPHRERTGISSGFSNSNYGRPTRRKEKKKSRNWGGEGRRAPPPPRAPPFPLVIKSKRREKKK